MTAAHCVENLTIYPWKVKVAVGQHLRVNPQDRWRNGNYNDVCCVVLHPKYEGYQWEFWLPFDFALLKLTTELTFNDNVMPVCLPAPPLQLRHNANLTASGWGHLYYGAKDFSDVLRKVQLFVDVRMCPNRWIINALICTHGTGANASSVCNGDSGGKSSGCHSLM
jgi:hypothetical protein